MLQKIKSIFLFIFLLQLTNCALENEDLANHISKCCRHGVIHARKNDQCENYANEVSKIPALWIGLCHSTYGVCCSSELENLHCVAGRLAAITGADCKKQLNRENATSSYADCCHWCHLGLAVKASDSNCGDKRFFYFNQIESYQICCNGPNQTEIHRPHNKKDEPVQLIYDLESNVEGDLNIADGTIVLTDDDGE